MPTAARGAGYDFSMTETHRILVSMLVQEVSSFNPVPSHARDFAQYEGEELFDSQRTGAREVGGALEVFESTPRVTAIPGWGGRAYSSDGVLSAEGFRELSGKFLDAVRANTDVD